MAINLVSRPILAPLAQIWAQKIIFHQFYLYYMLEIAASYHCMQFQGKPMNQTWENGRKSSVRLKFGPLQSKFSPKTFFVGFSSTRCYALL